MKADGITPGHLNVGNITIDGYYRIIWNTVTTIDLEHIGSIHFNNTSNRLTMELKGTVHDFNLNE